MALQGIEGTYIICRGDKQGELRLGDMLAVDDILRLQLLRLLPIANAYLYLRYESQKPSPDRLVRVCFIYLCFLFYWRRTISKKFQILTV